MASCIRFNQLQFAAAAAAAADNCFHFVTPQHDAFAASLERGSV